MAVETALVLPLLLGVGLVGVDMQRIHAERIRLENAAGVLAVNLSAQRMLTAPGLNALAELAMQGHEDAQHLILMNVRESGRVAWVLQRGGAQGLCAIPAAGGSYTGPLPEAPRAEADSDDAASPLSMIVVTACRDARAIPVWGGLSMPDTLRTTTVFRAAGRAIRLDDTLQAESRANALAHPDLE